MIVSKLVQYELIIILIKVKTKNSYVSFSENRRFYIKIIIICEPYFYFVLILDFHIFKKDSQSVNIFSSFGYFFPI